MKNILQALGGLLHNHRLLTAILVAILGLFGSAFTPLAGDIATLIDKVATAYEQQAVESDPKDAPTPEFPPPAEASDPAPADADAVPLPDKPEDDGSPA